MNPYGPPRPGVPPQFYGGPGAPPMMPPGGMMMRPGMPPPPRGLPLNMMPPPPSLAPSYGGPPPSSFPRPGAPPPATPQPLPAPPARSHGERGTAAPPPVLTPPRPGGQPKEAAARVQKSTTLVVSQIAPNVSNDFLESLIKACGPGTFKRPTDPDTGAPKLFGFVEFEFAESVIVALKVLNNLTVDGQDLKIKASNSTQEYIAWWEKNRGAEGVEAQPEDGEQGEDDSQREMRVMESVMDLISKRSTQKPSSEVDDLIGSVRREESSRARTREKHLEHEFEADRQRAEREARSRAAQEDREYKARLKEVERFEENLLIQRRKRRRQDEIDMKERQKLIKQDNEASDSEEEEERWRRKPYRFTTAAAARRAARSKEAQDDENDRIKELEEVAAHMQNGAGSSKGRDSAVEGHLGSQDTAAGAAGDVKKEVKLSLPLNPNDGIMKAMLAAATKSDDLATEGGWSTAPQAEIPEAKPEPREPPKRVALGIFGTDDGNAARGGRRPPAIQYSEEELRAVGAREPGAPSQRLPDIGELRKKVIADVPTTLDAVWSYPLKWDMLRLSDNATKEKILSKMAKSLEEVLGAEGASGVANDVFKMLVQHKGPAAVANFVDFLGNQEAQDFVFKTFRALIAESELHALNKQHGLA